MMDGQVTFAPLNYFLLIFFLFVFSKCCHLCLVIFNTVSAWASVTVELTLHAWEALLVAFQIYLDPCTAFQCAAKKQWAITVQTLCS